MHAVNLDPEELKDALLQQAIAQRRALVAACLKPGTGRAVKRAKYNIVIRPVHPEPVVLEAVASRLPQLSKTPASDGPLAQYPSPVEGIPERLSGRMVSNVVLRQGAGSSRFSPVEGLGELRPTFAAHVQHDLSGGNRSNSPIEGIVHQGPAAHVRPTQPAAMPHDFAFPSQGDRAEIAVQTGASIDGSAEKAGPAPAAFDYDDDFGGGFDDGGWDGWGDGPDGMVDEGPSAPQQMMPPPPARKPRRPVMNPGIRLRNQLPRKSLAVNPGVGRQEVAPGVRRSMRQAQQPLKWWLGEKKEFDRVAHKTLPTVSQVTMTDPNTPWRTVADYKDWNRERNAAKAAKMRARAQKKRGHTKKRQDKGEQDGDLIDDVVLMVDDEDDQAEEGWSDAETVSLPGSAQHLGDDADGGVDTSPVPMRAIDLTSPGTKEDDVTAPVLMVDDSTALQSPEGGGVLAELEKSNTKTPGSGKGGRTPLGSRVLNTEGNDSMVRKSQSTIERTGRAGSRTQQ